MEDLSESIHRACRLGDLTSLIELLEVSPSSVNVPMQKLAWTPLYRTVICGHFALAEYLLISGADPNLKTSSGDTALHSAVESNRLDLVQVLLKFGADVNMLQNDGESPLHLACFKGNAEVVQFLLDNKADPNVQNHILGKTPLHYAVDYNYSDVTRLLLKAGASHQIKDKYEKTAKDSARSVEILALFLESPSGIPSPEPSEILQKSSAEDVSGVMSKSDISFTSDLKTEEKAKIFEGMHSKIRQTVRASVENSRLAYSSFLNEPDEEKTAVEAFDRKKLMSFGTAESGSELYVWLCRRKLEQAYNLLVDAGYDDLKQIKMQMQSMMPICEASLEVIGIRKPGIRKRLLLAFQELSETEQNFDSRQKQFFKCCTVDVSSNVFIANCPALEEWLENLCLKQFYSVFVAHGYEEMDQILKLMNSPWEITADDLGFIGVDKPGYRHRILSKLKEDAFYLLGKKRPEEKKTNEICTIF